MSVVEESWTSWIRRQNVLSDVQTERLAQIAKWGEQGHESFGPAVMGRIRAGGVDVPNVAAWLYGVPTARSAKDLCQAEARDGDSSWVAILTEEFAEAIEAAALGDVAELRTELVQTAAVCVAWLEDIDRAAREASAVSEKGTE